LTVKTSSFGWRSFSEPQSRSPKFCNGNSFTNQTLAQIE
jgi:hypothetical protein